MPKKKPGLLKVESTRQKGKLGNISTEELRHFVAEDDHIHGTIIYPHDSSLDP